MYSTMTSKQRLANKIEKMERTLCEMNLEDPQYDTVDRLLDDAYAEWDMKYEYPDANKEEDDDSSEYIQ